jgi:hypothetical protein
MVMHIVRAAFRAPELSAAGSREILTTPADGSLSAARPPSPRFRASYCSSGVFGLNASHETFGFQFVNVPFGFSFHAHTCSV